MTHSGDLNHLWGFIKASCVYTTFCLTIALGVIIFSATGCSPGQADQHNRIEGYPIDSEVVTTLTRTVVPDKIPATSEKIYPYEVSKYEKNGYGKWHYGPRLDSVRRLDIMSPGYRGTTGGSTRLLNFFAITDIHITDKETPGQAVYFGYKGEVSSGYSAVMLYTTHVLDAAIQTVNALNQEKKFDFGISLGDTCNNTQYNELRWYIDVLDGRDMTPDSGVKDDPIPGPYNDYQDRYRAAGLDETIPWYQVLGNHDHFWMGFLPPNDYIRLNLTRREILNLGNPFIDPKGVDSRGFYLGSLDGRTVYGDVIGAGPVKDFAKPPQVLSADPKRRSMDRKQWIGEFFNSRSMPKGHGFNRVNLETGFACYSFEPKSDVPIKIIVLDDTQRDDDPNDPEAMGYGKGSFGYGHGQLDKQRYDWLIEELDKGQAQDKLMIIAAHIPIGVEPAGSMMAWVPAFQTELIAKLHTYPNLILWVAGHRHVNAITAFKSPNPDKPELGFWQIETSSLRDFPQQFRTFEIVRNSDKTISIITVDVDPAVKKGSLAAISRSYGVASQQLFDNSINLLPSGSYNAELVKQISIKMQEKIKNCSPPAGK
jgi:metallophosphoesterase (TIGR03768 family)